MELTSGTTEVPDKDQLAMSHTEGENTEAEKSSQVGGQPLKQQHPTSEAATTKMQQQQRKPVGTKAPVPNAKLMLSGVPKDANGMSHRPTTNYKSPTVA